LAQLFAYIAAALVFAGLAGSYALARLAEEIRPELSLALMPSLPPALEAKADAMIAENRTGDPAILQEARDMAQRALRASPLEPAALRVLAGTGPQDPAYIGRLVGTAMQLSRRDVGAQLLQIELAVSRNDVRGALVHYNIALSVSPSLGPVLYPILLSASDKADLLPSLRAMVGQDPQWLPSLISWTIDNPDNLRRLARLVSAIPPSSEALAPGYGQALVEAMVERGDLPAAFAVQQAYGRRTRVPQFAGGFVFRPIDWTTSDNYDTGSDLIESPAPHVHFFAEAGTQGVILSRLAALPAGAYRLAFALIKPADSAAGAMTLAIACRRAGGDEEISRAAVQIATQRFSQDFTVPASCPYQWLRFSVAARQAPLAGDMTGIALQRLP